MEKPDPGPVGPDSNGQYPYRIPILFILFQITVRAPVQAQGKQIKCELLHLLFDNLYHLSLILSFGNFFYFL